MNQRYDLSYYYFLYTIKHEDFLAKHLNTRHINYVNGSDRNNSRNPSRHASVLHPLLVLADCEDKTISQNKVIQ
jgi:hypothetical protein